MESGPRWWISEYWLRSWRFWLLIYCRNVMMNQEPCKVFGNAIEELFNSLAAHLVREVIQTSLPFKPRAAQNCKWFLSINYCLVAKYIYGTHALQEKAKMKRQEEIWVNAVVVENGGIKIRFRDWVWFRVSFQLCISLTINNGRLGADTGKADFSIPGFVL